jgi:hypothetical protein
MAHLFVAFALSFVFAASGEEGARPTARRRIEIRVLFDPYELPTRRRDLRDMTSSEDRRWRMA